MSLGPLVVAVIIAGLIILSSDKEVIAKREADRADREAYWAQKYKAVKVYGRTYNFFVVEIDGEEYVVGSDGSSITMVPKGVRNVKPSPSRSDGNVLPKR